MRHSQPILKKKLDKEYYTLYINKLGNLETQPTKKGIMKK